MKVHVENEIKKFDKPERKFLQDFVPPVPRF